MLRHALGTVMLLSVLTLGCGDDGGTTQEDSGPPPGQAPIGAECTKGSDCESVQCLTDQLMLGLLEKDGGVSTYGGYCIGLGCTLYQPCGEGAHCFDGTPYGAGMNVCLQTCTSQADCTRQNYECFTATDGYKGCVPGGLIQPLDGGGEDTAVADGGQD